MTLVPSVISCRLQYSAVVDLLRLRIVIALVL